MSTETVEKKVLPADYGKMPAGYNFLTRGRTNEALELSITGKIIADCSRQGAAAFQSLIMNAWKICLAVSDWNSKF